MWCQRDFVVFCVGVCVIGTVLYALFHFLSLCSLAIQLNICCVYDGPTYLFLHCSRHTTGMSHLKKTIYMFVIFFSGHMDNRCLATATFVKEVADLFDSFSGVTCSPDHGKLLRCRLTSTSKHMEYWRSAVDKVKTWAFLNKESEPMRPPPSQTGWLITIGAVQHVWRKVHKFTFLETRNLNQDALENTFGSIRLHCGSNNNPSIRQFVDALKTVIINGLAYRSLYGSNCEDDGASLLDKLHSFLESSNASSTSPSTSHDSETTDIVPDIFHIGKETQQGVSAAVRAYDVKMFSVAYVSGFIAKRLLNNSSCDTCIKCLISEVPLPLDIYTGFKEHSSTVQSLTYPTEKLVETVGTAVTVLENVMPMVAHLESVELYVTDAIKKGVDFDWIRSAGCSLHYQEIEDGIVRGVTRISIHWWCKQKNRSMNKASRQKVLKRKFQILSHQ